MVDRIGKTGTISGEKLYATLDPPRLSSAFSSVHLSYPMSLQRGFHARGKIAGEKYFVSLSLSLSLINKIK